jgi:hypothetical protein
VFDIKKALEGKVLRPGQEINCRCRAVLYYWIINIIYYIGVK